MKTFRFIFAMAIATLAMTSCNSSEKSASQEEVSGTDTTMECDSVETPAESATDEIISEGTAEPEAEPAQEPEPAGYGDDSRSSSAKSLTVNGVAIKKGEPIAATLRKFNDIHWEYTADYGITAYVGNVGIHIDEYEDLTAQGMEFMKGVYSDIEPDLKFSVDYIKPTAKISQIFEQ